MSTSSMSTSLSSPPLTSPINSSPLISAPPSHMPSSVAIGFQGINGAYSHQAIKELFNNSSCDSSAANINTTDDSNQKGERIKEGLDVIDKTLIKGNESFYPIIDSKGYRSFSGLHEALRVSEVDLAMVPIENTLGGTIHANYDLLMDPADTFGKPRAHVVGEYNFRIQHCLLAAPGVKKEDIKFVVSHIQALSQCMKYISHELNKATPTQFFDTAGAAKALADLYKLRTSSDSPPDGLSTCPSSSLDPRSDWRCTAAIAGREAAEEYGLNILDTNIQDTDFNFTRFLVLSKEAISEEMFNIETKEKDIPFKSSVVFAASNDNKPGALFKCMAAFALRDINLTKLESRPVPIHYLDEESNKVISPTSFDAKKNGKGSASRASPHSLSPSAIPHSGHDKFFHVLFFVDPSISRYDPAFIKSLSHLIEISPLVTVLGSYPVHTGPESVKDLQRFLFKHILPLTSQKCYSAEMLKSTSTPAPLEAHPAPVLTQDVSEKSNFPSEEAIVDREMCLKTGKRQSVHQTFLCPPHASTSLEFCVSPRGSNVLSIGIIGFGTFGQFLAERFRRRGHKVFATSRSDYSQSHLVRNCGVHFYPNMDISGVLDKANQIEVLILCTSILSFEETVKQLPLSELDGCLLVDVLSVKSHPKRVLLNLASFNPSCSLNVLCTHPLFGPDSGRESWSGLPFCYEKVKVTNCSIACEKFLEFFRAEGCRMVEMACECHDSISARSQFITHLTGRVLEKQNLSPSLIDTKAFEALLQLVSNTTRDSFDLFAGLYNHNDSSNVQLVCFANALNETIRKLRAGRKTAVDNKPTDGFPMSFSPLLDVITFAGTVALNQKVSIMRAANRTVHSLCVGMPDYPPPKDMIEGLIKALNSDDKDMYSYTPVGGILKLRKAICDDLKTRLGHVYSPDNITISNGAKQVLYQAILAICTCGDEVVIPTPCWVSYGDIVLMSGATPIYVKTSIENNFQITAELLKRHITPKTKLLILCSPSNPTGCVMSETELLKIAEFLSQPLYQHILVISDEIYDQLIYGSTRHISFPSLPNMFDRTLLVNGFSKTYSMCGYRIGYLATSSKPLIKAVNTIQSQICSCPNSISQIAAYVALTTPLSGWLAERKSELMEKRDLAYKLVLDIEGIECNLTEGAFYLFPKIKFYFGCRLPNNSEVVIKNSTDFCHHLLDIHGVALIAGEDFGEDGYLRISFASSLETIRIGMELMKKFCDSLIRP